MKQPRLDVSGASVIVDRRLSNEIRNHLAGEFAVKEVDNTIYPPQFAVPSVAEWSGREALGASYAEGPWPGSAVPTLR
jgi:hypothetical protein